MNTENSNNLNYGQDDTNCSLGPDISLNSNLKLNAGCDCGNLQCKKYATPNNIQNLTIFKVPFTKISKDFVVMVQKFL